MGTGAYRMESRQLLFVKSRMVSLTTLAQSGDFGTDKGRDTQGLLVAFAFDIQFDVSAWSRVVDQILYVFDCVGDRFCAGNLL